MCPSDRSLARRDIACYLDHQCASAYDGDIHAISATPAESVGVLRRAADTQQVISGPAVEQISAAGPAQPVAPLASDQDVGPCPEGKYEVIAPAANHDIVAAPDVHDIVAVARVDVVAQGILGCVNTVVTVSRDDGIRAGAGVDEVIPGTAKHDIVAAAGVHRVISGARLDPILAAIGSCQVLVRDGDASDFRGRGRSIAAA